ncbi:MAG TPA: branched-chain amino acid transport system II carrier protein [Parachlamydiaceae bacterium]|nr:branched-chain amino acid transport system II carrier protein [Parachlamydiaceae bacterium]
MIQIKKSNTLATGLAMFSMFFGAGNVVFPLALGQHAKGNTFFAILGLLITAVGVPFMGLVSMTLFDGNYKHFFERIGKVPGFLAALFMMGLIGPFGALPRCIALSYSTLQLYFPDISLVVFSLVSCLIIFGFTFKKNSILDVLGYVLTPVLLFSLGFIIVKGLLMSPEMPEGGKASFDAFFSGLKDGYQTMDLLGAFFFSSIVLNCLKVNPEQQGEKNDRLIIKMTLKASLIGASLLSLVYVGFSLVAAFHSDNLAGISQDKLIGTIALQVLGPLAGIAACIAVALACLTTAIALAAVFAEFVHNDISQGKIGYIPSLIGTLIITFFISTLDFVGIAKILVPILQVCYPALIILSLLNIAYKLYHFKPIKLPVFAVLAFSLASYFLD